MSAATQSLASQVIKFVEATFAPVNAEAGLDELGDDHELTITVAQFREFYELAKADQTEELVEALHDLLTRPTDPAARARARQALPASPSQTQPE